MDKTVKGATKIKLAAPKTKYVEPILSATRTGETGVADVFSTLQLRLRDSTWTIVFKALIVAHLMIREGSPEVTLRFLADSPKRLAISQFTEVQTQGVNIRRYFEYLMERVKAYQDTNTDFVRSGAGKMRTLSIDKGLLRQTEIVQAQIKALLKCDLLGGSDPDNEISMTAFRLLTMDLLELFKVMNEGTINVLEHYFEMSKVDAERALSIYKTFGRQTDLVVNYLSVARQYQAYTKLEVPKLKHAPTTLTSSLEDYLNDPDFEVNRRQYLAQQESKRTGKPIRSAVPATTPAVRAELPTAVPSQPPKLQLPKAPAADLMDFFESIEQNQQPLAQQSYSQDVQMGQNYSQPQTYQQPQIIPQQTAYNPFMQNYMQQPQQQQQPQVLQQNFTGAGFGGYGPQPQQSQPYAFASEPLTMSQGQNIDFSLQQQQQRQQQQQQQVQSPIQTQSPQSLQPQPTATNPFRQSMISQTQTVPGTSSPFTNTTTLNRSATNPFAKHSTNAFQQQTQSQPQTILEDQQSTFQPHLFSSPPPQEQLQSQPQVQPQPPSQQFLQQQQQQQQPHSLTPQRTGTNPFSSKPLSQPQHSQSQPTPTIQPLPVNVTGSTNPFRQSQFVNQATGQGWQHSNQGTFGGFDVNWVQTVGVFPRPGVQGTQI